MADKPVHEHVDGQHLYHERQLLCIAGWFKADVFLSSTDDAIAATREDFGEEQLLPSPAGDIVMVSMATGDKDVWDFGDMLEGLSIVSEQCCVVMDNIWAW